MYRLLSLLLLLSGCGTYEPADWFFHERINKRHTHYIDPLFKPVLAEFQREAYFYGVGLPLYGKLRRVEFGETKKEDSPRRVGVCNTYLINGRVDYTRITIHPRYKEKLDSIDFRALMFHELGHCILDKDHTETSPATLMNPTIPNNYYLLTNWDKLLDNFFLGTPLE